MKIRKLFLVAFLFIFCLQNVKAQQDTLTLFSELKKSNSDTQKVNLLINLSNYFIYKDLKRSFSFATQAIEKAKQINFKEGIARSYFAIGDINFMQGDYDKSEENLTNSLQLFSELNKPVSIGEAINGIGRALYKIGKTTEALQKYIAAVEIFEKYKYNKGLTSVYINLGLLYEDFANYTLALEYYNKALKIATEENDEKSMASCYNNIGSVYSTQEKYALSIENFNKSLQLKLKAGNKKGAGSTYNNIGALYYEIGNNNTALEYFEKAYAIYIEIDDKKGIFPSCNNVGKIYQEKGDNAKALVYFEKAYALALERGSLKDLIYCMENLSMVHKGLGNYKKAYDISEKTHLLKDSLYNSELTSINSENLTKYATEKKQQENEFLNLKVKSESFIKTIFIIAACLLLLLAFYIYNGLRQKKKANKALEEKNEIIENQKHIVEEQNKDITDSIKYAERIQNAILPPPKMWEKLLPLSFVLYKPKDILSGDFYWIEEKEDLVFVAAADCTGHGVPGALISIVNYNLLNKATLEKNLNDSADILNYVNTQLTLSLHQSYQESAVRDGMDISLCVINRSTMELAFTGANNPIYLIRNGVLQQIEGDKFPVGAFIEEKIQQFSSKKIQLEKNDCLYLFSDGYADQFGGEKGKKFKYKQLKETLLEIQHLPMNDQKERLDKTFKNWKGSLEQIDDVLIIGIKV